jgi:hydroxymethylbilane synthase
VVSIRGNVDTRIRKVESGAYDGAVLAVAGLDRLSLLDRATQVFSVAEMLPAVGQGVLAIECRSGDQELEEKLAQVDHHDSRVAATAERSFLAALGAGCRLPVGAYAAVEQGTLHLEAMLADEGGVAHRARAAGPVTEAEALGRDLAHRLRREAAIS